MTSRDVEETARFRILGPLRYRNGAGWHTLPAAQQRAVLALLLVLAGRPVPVDRIVDELWADTPPRSARNTIQGYVVRLRRTLACPLVTRGGSYQLDVPVDGVDSAVFERLVRSARSHAQRGDLLAADADLTAAEELWRGPAFADVPHTATVAVEAARLTEAQLGAIEWRMQVQLDLGRHAEVAGELAALVEKHPLREGLWAALMLARYRCGRRAEALAAFRHARRVLVAEFGLEPGPEMRELERRILADDLAGRIGVAPVPR